MAAGEIVLAFGDQHFSGGNQLLLDRFMRRFFAVRLEHFSHPTRLTARIIAPTPSHQNRELHKPQEGKLSKVSDVDNPEHDDYGCGCGCGCGCDAETQDVTDIVSCHALPGLLCRHHRMRLCGTGSFDGEPMSVPKKADS